MPHIALEEAGAEFEPVSVMLAEGEHLKPEYLAINPHARVPALAPNRAPSPRISRSSITSQTGSERRARCRAVTRIKRRAAMNCSAGLLHRCTSRLPRSGGRNDLRDDESVWEAIQAGGRKALEKHFGEIEARCGDGWLLPGRFTAADSYALIFFRWGRRIGNDMAVYPNWAALCRRVVERPAVQRALQREGFSAEQFADG